MRIKEKIMIKDEWAGDYLPGQVNSLREANQQLQIKIRAMEEDVRFLRALENAGVDNWDGYEYACRAMEAD